MTTEVSTRGDAIARAERIRSGIRSLVELQQDITDAYHARDWQTLGYDTWEAYVAGEFGHALPRLGRDERRELVVSLRAEGLSTRAIASATGADDRTVRRDLSGAANAAPDDEGDGDAEAELEPKPQRPVTGLDGKTYSPRSTRPDMLSDDDLAELNGAKSEPEPRPATAPAPRPQWSDNELELRDRMQNGETVVVSMRGDHDNLISWAETHGRYQRIDRRTEWGNPFELPADGDRDTVIANYRDHYLPHKPSLLSKLDTLAGKALGCWCAPEPCHGDVLKEATEQ